MPCYSMHLLWSRCDIFQYLNNPFCSMLCVVCILYMTVLLWQVFIYRGIPVMSMYTYRNIFVVKFLVHFLHTNKFVTLTNWVILLWNHLCRNDFMSSSSQSYNIWICTIFFCVCSVSCIGDNINSRKNSDGSWTFAMACPISMFNASSTDSLAVSSVALQ